MEILIKLHARAAELAGAPEAHVRVADPATCRDVKQALAAAHPGLEGLVGSSALATETEYLRDSAPAVVSTLHLIPPVSGG